jgi:hypothetical protein
MSGQKRPSTGLQDHKNSKPCINIYRVPRGREPLTWFNSSQWFDRGSEAAAPRAPEYEQGMHANPIEGFQGGDDAGTGTAHTHSHAHVHAHIPHTRSHTCTHTCLHRYTCKHTKVHASEHVYTPTCTLTHTYTHA